MARFGMYGTKQNKDNLVTNELAFLGQNQYYSDDIDFLIYFINLQHDNHSLNNFHNWVSLKSGRQ
jgi:hypothetical protein